MCVGLLLFGLRLSAVAFGEELWHGKSGLQAVTPNVIVAIETIDQTVQHGGSSVKLVRAEMAFETYSDHFSLHAYKLREGFTDGGCREIDPSAADRDCFELYKCQFRVDKVHVFRDSNGNGAFDEADGDTMYQEVALQHSRGGATEMRVINDSGIPVHYKRYMQDSLQTEYFATPAATEVGAMALAADSLEAKYTVNIKSGTCSDCILVFHISFTSKATADTQGAGNSGFDGLTFGERNDGYLVWAKEMLAEGFAAGGGESLKVVKTSEPGMPSSSGKDGGVSMFDTKMQFRVHLPSGVSRVSWDPVLGTTEFGSGFRGNQAQIVGSESTTPSGTQVSTSSVPGVSTPRTQASTSPGPAVSTSLASRQTVLGALVACVSLW